MASSDIDVFYRLGGYLGVSAKPIAVARGHVTATGGLRGESNGSLGVVAVGNQSSLAWAVKGGAVGTKGNACGDLTLRAIREVWTDVEGTLLVGYVDAIVYEGMLRNPGVRGRTPFRPGMLSVRFESMAGWKSVAAALRSELSTHPSGEWAPLAALADQHISDLGYWPTASRPNPDGASL